VSPLHAHIHGRSILLGVNSPALEILLRLCRTGQILGAYILRYMANLTCSLSVIIICRCQLALQERVAHPNGTTHSEHHPVTSFRAATRKIHNSLMEEFGDPSVDETGISEAIEPHGKDGSSSNPISESAIELEEISRGRERAIAVDDSSGEALDGSQHGKSPVRFL
jgi:hypothetical protein